MSLLGSTAFDRFNTLCKVQFAEGRRLLEIQIARVNAECAQRGLINSGARLALIISSPNYSVAGIRQRCQGGNHHFLKSFS